MHYSAIVMAAGCGSRFIGGTHKLLVNYNGCPLIRTTVKNTIAAGFDKVIVVTGSCSHEVMLALDGLPISLVYNENWKTGQASSLVCGLLQLQENTDSACLVLGDQPFVTPDTLSKLKEAQLQFPDENIAPEYDGKRGNPVLVPSCYFSDLINNAEGDYGGRRLLKEKGVRIVIVTDPGVINDVDTLDDYNKFSEQN